MRLDPSAEEGLAAEPVEESRVGFVRASESSRSLAAVRVTRAPRSRRRLQRLRLETEPLLDPPDAVCSSTVSEAWRWLLSTEARLSASSGVIVPSDAASRSAP